MNRRLKQNWRSFRAQGQQLCETQKSWIRTPGRAVWHSLMFSEHNPTLLKSTTKVWVSSYKAVGGGSFYFRANRKSGWRWRHILGVANMVPLPQEGIWFCIQVFSHKYYW